MNRRDYTKKRMSRSVSNPCLYDYNMKSRGAPSFVRNQLTFTGGIASFIGETPMDPFPASHNQSSNRNGSQSARPLNMGDLLQHNVNAGNVPQMEDVQKIKFRPATSESAKLHLNNVNKKTLAGCSNEALSHLSQKLNSARVSAGPRKASAASQNGRSLNENMPKNCRPKNSMDSKIERKITEEKITEQLIDILRSIQVEPNFELKKNDVVIHRKDC